MRVADIIRLGQPCRLRHPTVGDVLWTDVPGQGFEMVIAMGPEKGDALVADASVLLDNTWTVAANDIDKDDDATGSEKANR